MCVVKYFFVSSQSKYGAMKRKNDKNLMFEGFKKCSSVVFASLRSVMYVYFL